jgi:hypothetical protein
MMRATRKGGTEDLGELVEGYRFRSFGFASSNFFTELLAVIEVEKNSEKYFGPVERAQPIPSYEVTMPDFIKTSDLIRYMGFDFGKFRELNPALTEAVFSGQLLIPAGYRLRLLDAENVGIEKASQHFFKKYSEIPSELKYRMQLGAK